MKKLTLIGGGSVRTYYFIESLLRFYRRMEIGEVAVMDTDPVKLRYFGGLAKYLCTREKAELRVTLDGEPDEDAEQLTIRDDEVVINEEDGVAFDLVNYVV
ncbi:MAG: hypothetical protein IKF65_10420, partial [Clostridia bacterium]|nr:hypothetical protein [Clostridia bacterium]